MAMCKDVIGIDHKSFHRINLVGKIERKSQHTKQVNTKYGQARICGAYIRDETGTIQLTLWDNDIERVKDGYTIKIEDGYVSAWYGVRSLTTKRSSPLRIISTDPNYNDKPTKPKKLFQPSANAKQHSLSEDSPFAIVSEKDQNIPCPDLGEIAKIERQYWRESLA